LARYADKLPKQANGETIVFHDPCYLGRYRNVYERARVQSSVSGELVEAPRNHERSFCCGRWRERIGLSRCEETRKETCKQVRAAGACRHWSKNRGTACPFCNSMFRDALAEKGEARRNCSTSPS